MLTMLSQNYISINYKRLLLGIGTVLLLLNCTQKQEVTPTIESDVLNVKVTDPVYRDFDDIQRTGVLRMITSYSSGSYFLYRGIQVGFEYELVKEFARQNNLAVEVIIPTEDENPYDLLNSGAGDIIAASYTITDERKKIVDFTRPYNLVNQMIVVSDKLGLEPESITDLAGIPIAIRRNSSYYHTLMDLKEQGFDIQIELVPQDMDTESLLFQVARGTYKATVADDHIFSASSNYMNGLIKGPQVSERDEIAWAIRKNSNDLEAQLNKFLYQHFKYDEDGVPKRSAFLNVLRKKYFKGSNQIADYFNPEYQTRNFGSISPYDSLMKSVGEEFGLDWVMLTAIAAQESKFDPYSESWAGAVGIMQVLPRFSEISLDSLYVPEYNIREGARIISEHLDHYAYMDSTNRWQFALATYNAGMGHLADARRLSIDQNKNPNEWENVSESLLKLMQRRYYQHARYGFARGIETVRYVNEIMNRYNTYQAILALANTRNERTAGIFGIKTFNSP
tara:strand:- start:21221 stop:22744 length:1524 start_codon:yes stop_codon:yes gene_type:complete